MPSLSFLLRALLLGVGGLLGYQSVWAQDVRFSQPYASGLHLNPALAGTTAVRSLTVITRDQYPTLGGGFLTGALVGDVRLHRAHGALGVAIAYDRAGEAPLNRFLGNLVYAYHTGLSANWSASGAISAGYGQQRGSLGRYTFGDQLLLDGSTGATAETTPYFPASYLTLGTGIVAYSKRAWIGAAGHHLNSPKLGSWATASRLAPRLAVHGGYKIYLLSALSMNRFYEFSLTPVATVQLQGKARGYDVGFYTTYSPLTLGLVYRNPLLISPSPDQHWLVATLGLAQKGWRLAYSYDYGFGQQTRGATAHELTFRLEELDYSGLLKKRTSHRIQPFLPAPAW